MLSRVRQWLEPPVFPGDEAKTSQARTMNTLGLIFAAALVVAGAVFVPVFTVRKAESFAFVASLLIGYVVGRWFLFRGHVVLAGAIVLLPGWIILAGAALISGGVASPLMFSVATVATVAGLLLSRRVGGLLVAASIVLGLAFAVLQQSGAYLPQRWAIPPASAWFLYTISMVFMTGVMHLTVSDLRNALGRAREQGDALREAEKSLRDSEARFRTISDNALAGVYIIQDDRLTYVNEAMAKTFGYGPGELIGAGPLQIVHPGDHELVTENIRRRVSGEIPSLRYEFRGLRKDGGERRIEVLGTAVVLAGRSAIVGNIVDVTERTLAEEALRGSERKFRALVDNSVQGVILYDGDRLGYVNPKLCEILGRDPLELAAVLPQRAKELVHPDDRSRVAERNAQYLRGEAVDERDSYRVLRKDGGVRHVEASARSLAVGGRPLGIVTMIDVTERALAEAALRESEARFRALFEQAGDHIFILTPTPSGGPVIVDANDAACERHGYTRDELLGMRLVEIDAERDRELVAQRVSRIMDGERVIFETVHRRKDGSTFPVEVSAQRVDHEGKPPVIFTIERDITERRRAAEDLARVSRRSATILNAAGEGILGLDLQGCHTFVNPAAARMLGYTVEELIGRPSHALWHHTRADGRPLPEAECSVYAAYRDGAVHTRDDEVFWRKDGTSFSVEYTSTPIQSEGVPAGAVLVFRDITEHLRLTAQFQQAQKMESVGRLAGGVAHDFNNMLGVILGHAEILLDDLDPALPQCDAIREIRTAAQRSADLTRQLLAFARRQAAAPRVLDLNETVEGMLKILRRLIGEDINLAWQPGAGLWPVKIDPAQVDQVLANLCVNARDAISGVGSVTIETENVAADDAYCAEHPGLVAGDHVLLAVSDNGSGIDEAARAHIFEPFFTTKGAGRGTGLGLATVYGIVKQNNGLIEVQSEPGRGATFRVFLARDPGQVAEPQAEEGNEGVRGGSETVLVVEDETVILNVTATLLQNLGYRVLATSSAARALEIVGATSDEIHLLVTDVVMPEMNGRDLATRLVELRPGLKHLYTSGYTADVIADHGVLAEGVHFLQKPFTMRGLAGKVREALED